MKNKVFAYIAWCGILFVAISLAAGIATFVAIGAVLLIKSLSALIGLIL